MSHDTYLAWHKGEPIGVSLDFSSAEECSATCKETKGYAGWTLYTRNEWCTLKSEEQVKPESKPGFESEILDAQSQFCQSEEAKYEVTCPIVRPRTEPPPESFTQR